jgi:hypothetical protein
MRTAPRRPSALAEQTLAHRRPDLRMHLVSRLVRIESHHALGLTLRKVAMRLLHSLENARDSCSKRFSSFFSAESCVLRRFRRRARFTLCSTSKSMYTVRSG